MRHAGEEGSIVTLICDSGDRYADTYFNESWLAEQGLDIAPHMATIRQTLQEGVSPLGLVLDQFDRLARST